MVDEKVEITTHANSPVRVSLKTPILVNSGIERDFDSLPDEPDKDLYTHHYTAIATLADANDNLYIYQCSFTGGQSYDGKQTVTVHAEYVVGIETTGEPSPEFIQETAANAIEFGAWARFCDLFAVQVAQMHVRLPSLPGQINTKFVSLDEYQNGSVEDEEGEK